ncbi:(2Fe-2S)-binding protein [Curvibacter sp. HBC61]|uniref:(2Fe-2S)-binding protein n=1 Tax=Curvibacter cyanobacteriorum TaxID=3026422 RepID=A0ABT5N3Q3_9BURK|nr:(2Fe-2S)-binding protein [Curvibacter sp. HBC61]MDD0840266.1 (2Fe-2S)-binding protein [Curvibacter sp. HBC61]
MNPHALKKTGPGLLHRVTELAREPVPLHIDGQPCTALAGDTVLTALLTQRTLLRQSDFSLEPRAGFCLMGACQDCWVSTEDGQRLRACATPVSPGLRVLTRRPQGPA